MASPGVFSGAALATPDKLGRLALPAVLRNSVSGEGKQRQLFVTTHEVAPCLVGSGVDRLATISARIDRAEDIAVQRGIDFDRFAMERRLFGPGETLPMDGSGRFILSDVLGELAGLGSDIFFYGVGQTFEIWDCACLLALDDASYANVQAAARAALRVRARKAGGE
ncbi:MAG: hypothetical protein ABL909_02455 [Sphingopyxis sp.]